MLAQLGLDVIEADLVSTSVSVSVGERGDESRRPTDATASSLTRNLRPQSPDQARTRMHAGSHKLVHKLVATFSLLYLGGDSGM